jgi:uncharacterized protein
MSIPVLIENLPALLSEFPDISLVYLFGSRVSVQTGPMSDFDIAILTAAPHNGFTTQVQFQHALSRLLNAERVDVVLLNRTSIELAYHIISTGKLCFQKNIYIRVKFEADVLSRYGDYLRILRTFKNQTLQGGAHAKRVQRYRETLRRT